MLEARLKLKSGTLDNVARDLVMMGVCKYDRKNKRLALTHTSQRETLAAAWRFFSSHALLRELVEQFGKGFRGVSLTSVESALAREFEPQDYTNKTVRALTLRLLAWLQAFGIVSFDGANSLSHEVNQPVPTDLSQLRITQHRRGKSKLFVGEAPPVRVLEVLTQLQTTGYSPTAADRNSLYALLGLRLISSTTQPTLVEKPPNGAEEAWLASKVVAQPLVRVTRALLRKNPNVSALEVGEAFESLSPRGLSEASKRRYGSGVLVWVYWLHDLVTGKFEKS